MLFRPSDIQCLPATERVELLLSMAIHVFVWGKTFDPVEFLAIIFHVLFPFYQLSIFTYN